MAQFMSNRPPEHGILYMLWMVGWSDRNNIPGAIESDWVELHGGVRKSVHWISCVYIQGTLFVQADVHLRIHPRCLPGLDLG